MDHNIHVSVRVKPSDGSKNTDWNFIENSTIISLKTSESFSYGIIRLIINIY